MTNEHIQVLAWLCCKGKKQTDITAEPTAHYERPEDRLVFPSLTHDGGEYVGPVLLNI